MCMANAGARLKAGKESNPASRMFGCKWLLNEVSVGVDRSLRGRDFLFPS
jgi:hypothetical protein